MACDTRARSTMVAISPERSIGIVVTTTPPALSTPSQEANSIALLGPRRKTRLPGTRPSRSTRSRATRALRAGEPPGDPVRQVIHLAIGPGAGIVDNGKRGRVLFVDQLDGGVQALRI